MRTPVLLLNINNYLLQIEYIKALADLYTYGSNGEAKSYHVYENSLEYLSLDLTLSFIHIAELHRAETLIKLFSQQIVRSV